MNAEDLREQARLARNVAWSLGDLGMSGPGGDMRPSSVVLLEALRAQRCKLVEDDAEGVASAVLYTLRPGVERVA